MLQDAKHSLARARAALKYIVLAISGHMDDILGKYKVHFMLDFLMEEMKKEEHVYSFLSSLVHLSKCFGNKTIFIWCKTLLYCVIALIISHILFHS